MPDAEIQTDFFREDTFFSILVTHAAPCFFIGIIFIELFESHLSTFLRGRDLHHLAIYLPVALSNGLLTGLTVMLIHLGRNRRHKKRPTNLFSKAFTKRQILLSGAVGFLAGALALNLILSVWGLLIIPFILFFVIIHLRRFLKNMAVLLQPDRHATWPDACDLILIYVGILTSFTLLNLMLMWFSHEFQSVPMAFSNPDSTSFLMDSLYFSVVMMTTVGFGDIHPISYTAKMLVTFQCFVSYFMFALIIGILTRGIIMPKQNGDA